MTRKPVFWISFALLAVLAIVAAWSQFSAAFPLVSIDLRMDRATTLGHRLGQGVLIAFPLGQP